MAKEYGQWKLRNSWLESIFNKKNCKKIYKKYTDFYIILLKQVFYGLILVEFLLRGISVSKSIYGVLLLLENRPGTIDQAQFRTLLPNYGEIEIKVEIAIEIAVDIAKGLYNFPVSSLNSLLKHNHQ